MERLIIDYVVTYSYELWCILTFMYFIFTIVIRTYIFKKRQMNLIRAFIPGLSYLSLYKAADISIIRFFNLSIISIIFQYTIDIIKTMWYNM